MIMITRKMWILTIVSAVLVTACTTVSAEPVVEIIAPTAAVAENPVQLPPVQPEAVLVPYSLEALREREYGLGEFRVEYTWHDNVEFTRYYTTYDSDGLNIHGYVNIPKGNGPFPVVIALHGYIPPSEYTTLDYSTRYADSIARKGYIVLHPNMRNFPPSDSPGRTRDFQAGYTIDVMNMLAYVRQQAGQPGSIFEKADVENIGIWGHSLGGGVALRMVGLVEEIKAAVLYGAVSQRYTNSSAGFTVIDLENTGAAFSVHHGEADETISVSWSYRLCEQLDELGKEHECFFYEGAPHTFLRQGQDDPVFILRTVQFLDRHLKDA